ncbi:MAG: efflux RND transporter periplasmic adaptor subunit [Planctomycetia bacterium]|nr:efflux RND transporter periplasmic adaptor subunit [Planctomycetia bacterium]
MTQEPAKSSLAGGGASLSSKVKSLRLSGAELREPGGSSKLPWVLCLLLACSTGYLAWQAYLAPASTKSSDAAAEADGSKTAGGMAGTGRSADVAPSGNLSLDSKGYIVPAHQILVSPKVGGMVKYLRIHKPGQAPEEGIPLEEGLRVEKGDILAVLESTDYESDVARCRAQVASAEQRLAMERKNVPQEIDRAQAELSEAVTQRDYFKTVHDRNVSLSKKGSVSPNELEKSQSDYEASRHRVERLERALDIVRGPRAERIKVSEAEVSSARADLVKAEWRLDNCTIVAPITGTLLRKNVEEGNIVNPVAFNGSYSVCDMADLSNLEVDLSIQERDISRVFKDQRCIVRAEAYPERQYSGHVSRLMPIADRAKGSVSVRVKIRIPAEEEGVYLKPEMGAIVTFYAADAAVPKVEASVPDGAESAANR